MNREPYRGTGRTMSLLFGCCLIVIAIVFAGVGYEQSFVVSASRSQDVVEAARAELEKAIANERANRTKEAGLAVDAALAKYNAAVEAASGGGKGTPGKVQTPAGPTPTITPETEPNNTSGTAQVLSSTENCFIVQGAVTPSGDLDYYRLDNVPAGARAWFYTDTGGTLVAGDRDSFIDVLAADGTTSIESDDDDGTGNGGDGTTETGFASSIAGRTLTTGGTYFFRVRGFGTFPGSSVVNPYRMFLVITNIAATAEVEPNGTFGTANSLVTATQPTGIRSGTISSSGEVDFYSVEATAGNILFISMDGDPGRTGTNTLDGVVTLLAPDGTTTLIQADSGFASATNSEAFDFNISTTGTYFVRVAGFSTESGRNYHIMVTACASPTPVCTPSITVTEGDLNPGGIVTFGVTSGPGSVTIDHVNAGIGTTSITVVGVPVNAVVQIPAFTPGTFAPVVVTFTAVDPNQPVDFTLRAAGGFMVGVPTAAFIRVRCGVAVCTSITCPANITTSNTANTCGAVVTYAAPATGGTCATPTCVPASGFTFPVGTTTVTCTTTGPPPQTCTFTVTVQDTQPPSITCPANISKPNDPNQCGAVVSYPAPTVSDNCPGVGTPVCSPASGSSFPVGTTTVTCTVADASPNSPDSTCSFTITVNDTEKPTIICPAPVTAVTDQNACPSPACQVANYPAPVAMDNCPGPITTQCNPPSGSCFPVGVTTVTCTATDTSGNISLPCTFTVTTFDVALQDDSNPSTILLWNSISGQYRLCCNGVTYIGVGKPNIHGCIYTLDGNAIDRRVLGRVDKAVHAGTASIQSPPGTARCTIFDRNTLNDLLLPACQ